MTRPLDGGGSVELAVVERSGMVESRHLGAAALVDAEGRLVRSLGDTAALIYPRSSLKPLQALTVLESGLLLRPVQAVLATASHAGTDEHVAVVESILTEAGLDASALQCPADWPFDPETRRAMERSGGGKSAIRMNCSGKHAAFLAASQLNDWPLDSYLNPEHPLQQRIRSTVEQLASEPVVQSGTDGCGAPVHALSLAGLAKAISRIAGPSAGPSAAFLTSAVKANGWAIDGRGRANTVAIERLGVLAKGGAEGVMVMATGDGTAVAVKILDGSPRAATLVALELLVSAGAVTRDAADEVLAATLEPVLGGGLPVGAIRASL